MQEQRSIVLLCTLYMEGGKGQVRCFFSSVMKHSFNRQKVIKHMETKHSSDVYGLDLSNGLLYDLPAAIDARLSGL